MVRNVDCSMYEHVDEGMYAMVKSNLYNNKYNCICIIESCRLILLLSSNQNHIVLEIDLEMNAKLKVKTDNLHDVGDNVDECDFFDE